MRCLTLLLPLLLLSTPLGAQTPTKPGAAPKKSAPRARARRPRRSPRLRLKELRVNLALKQASLEAFVDYCRKASGLNFVVRKHVIRKEIDLDAIEITIRLRNVSLADALRLVLEQHGLAAVVRRNIVTITTRRDARGKPVLRIYEVAEIVMPIRDFPAPDINLYPSSYEPPEPPEPEQHVAVDTTDELAELLHQFTGKDTWEDEGIQLMVFRRHLVIRQYPGVHREIARFLALVRTLR
ncbi:MAG: STN domain-containing protein [Planctomycetota bacterium]